MAFTEFPKKIHYPDRSLPSVVVYDEIEEENQLREWGLIEGEPDTRVDLIRRATALNIKIDNRWSDHRLERVVGEAEKCTLAP